MAEHTNIGWMDATWPLTTGCDDASPGCLNCWSKRDSHRLKSNPNPKVAAAYAGTTGRRDGGPIRWTGRMNLLPERLGWPLRWRKPRRIFVNSASDLFHPDVPDEFIAAVFGVMASCPDHTFQVLTKRADRLPVWFAWVGRAKRGYWHGENGLLLDCLAKLDADAGEAAKPGYKRATRLRWPDLPDPVTSLGDSSLGSDWPLPNVWLGVSTEDQKRADERVPHLLRCPAAVRFLSVEPLLGPIDLTGYLGGMPAHERHAPNRDGSCFDAPRLDWVIIGGESGPGARACDAAWIRSIVGRCRDAGVAAFVKQIGARPYDSDAAKDLPGAGKLWTDADRRERPAAMVLDLVMTLDAMALPIADRKGGDVEDIRVRQMPEPAGVAR